MMKKKIKWDIINFQDNDYFKEINEGNKKVNLYDFIVAKIEKNIIWLNKKENKFSKTRKKEEQKDKKRWRRKMLEDE